MTLNADLRQLLDVNWSLLSKF